jgi:hypothetical protein
MRWMAGATFTRSICVYSRAIRGLNKLTDCMNSSRNNCKNNNNDKKEEERRPRKCSFFLLFKEAISRLCYRMAQKSINLLVKRTLKCARNVLITFLICRSQWPRGLSHELSSPARTLGSWVGIPLEAWMSVCVYNGCR